MTEEKKPRKKKFDIAKILADPEAAISEFLSSPDVISKIPGAIANLPEPAKEALAKELSKYIVAAPQKSDIRELALEVSKLIPNPELVHIPTAQELAAEVMRLLPAGNSDVDIGKLASLVSEKLDKLNADKIADKVRGQISVQYAEKINNLNKKVELLEGAIKKMSEQFPNMVVEIAGEVVKKNFEELNEQIKQKQASQQPEGPELNNGQEEQPGMTGIIVDSPLLNAILGLGERYPKVAEMIIDKITGQKPKSADAALASQLGTSYKWHKIWKDIEEGKGPDAIAAITKAAQEQPGS